MDEGKVWGMTISERVIDRLKEIGMTQKEFSEKTGIKQSTISEWKKNKTNPTSDKIWRISTVLGVTPEWLLTGVTSAGSRSDDCDYYLIDKKTELGILIEKYSSLNSKDKTRIEGYIDSFDRIDN